MRMTAPFMAQAINEACAIKISTGITVSLSASHLPVHPATNHLQDPNDPRSSMDSQDKFKSMGTIIQIPRRNHPKREVKLVIAQGEASGTTLMGFQTKTTTTIVATITKDNLRLKIICKTPMIMSITYLRDLYSSKS